MVTESFCLHPGDGDLAFGAEASAAQLVDFVRSTLEPRGQPRLDSLWRAPLRQLHRELIAPIETSGILNLTMTAVKTRLSRARIQLRKVLSQYFKKRN